MNIHEFCAFMLTGQIVCTGSPSAHDAIAWVGVAPLPGQDAMAPALLVFSFELDKAQRAPGQPVTLRHKRSVKLDQDLQRNVEQAAEVLQSWHVGIEQMNEAGLERDFPMALVSTLAATPRFQSMDGGPTGLSDSAYAALFEGDDVCSEIEPSSDDLRAWVTVEPGGAWTGGGSLPLRVYCFEVNSASIEAGYDVVGELLHEREAHVPAHASLDDALAKVIEFLGAWGIHKTRFIRRRNDPDYPL